MKRTGFTLIEIMIVTVLIGLLVLIAFPRLRRYRERAIVASMMAELRDLQLSQEAFYTKNFEFATSLAELTEYTQSIDIVITLQVNARSGWTAQAAHTATTVRCSVFAGRLQAVVPLPPATDEGIVVCA